MPVTSRRRFAIIQGKRAKPAAISEEREPVDNEEKAEEAENSAEGSAESDTALPAVPGSEEDVAPPRADLLR